ncbi:MAG: two-component regulator propeller domain-containing protein [Schleiferiaceae bacterium]
MKWERLQILILALFAFSATGQDVTSYGVWLDYLSYFETIDVIEDDRYVYTAAQKGLFITDKEEESIVKKSKLNGLSDIDISALAYSQAARYVVIGYSNGNLDLLQKSGTVINLNDILRTTKHTGLKRINHILTKDEFAYVCTDFGVVKIDLLNLIVLETWLLGDQGNTSSVQQIAYEAQSDRFYLADNEGVKWARSNDPLVFFGSWNLETGLPPGNYNKIAAANGRVMVNWLNPIDTEDSLYVLDNNTWSVFMDKAAGRTNDLQSKGNEFLITTGFNIMIFDADLNQRMNISPALFPPGEFFPGAATLSDDGTTVYCADLQMGMYRIRNSLGVRKFVPGGPASNNAYSMKVINNDLYVTRGSINEVWAPQFFFEGLYVYRNFTWSTLESEDLGNSRDVLDVIGNPADPEEVFAASWGKGLIQIQNDIYNNTYTDANTDGAIQPVGGEGDDFRIGGMAYDESGTLWFTNALVNFNLCSLSPNGVFNNYSLGSAGGFQTSVKDIAIGDQGYVFIQARNSGVIAFRQVNGVSQSATLKQGEGSGNLPSNGVLSLAVDKDGELWIGTDQGLVVQYAPEALFTGGANRDAQPVIFTEEGVNQKLLGVEAVTDIAVDGANNKWFGTANAGVFYTSENGRETIYRFTAENSPLISNTILDIEIDPQSGEVFFATPDGIVSFRGQATEGFEDYTDVYAYPNPVEPNYQGPIAIKGLVTNARVKITDLEGNIVSEMVANGGQAIWDGRTLDGQRVASGVYMAYCTNDDGSKTHVTKIVVIR